MRLAHITLLATLALAACSSKQGDVGENEATTDAGPAGAAQGLAGHDTNPQGVPYPQSTGGVNARGLVAGQPSKTKGDVIANYKFRGYPSADKSKGLQTIALADYFDPTAKVKVLHLMAVDVWCSFCNDETSSLVKLLADQQSDAKLDGVVFLQAMAEGPTLHRAATEIDLGQWIDLHHATFTEVLDPGAANLGVFFNPTSVPWNANIDARTMEILSSDVGYEDLTSPATITVWVNFEKANALQGFTCTDQQPGTYTGFGGLAPSSPKTQRPTH